MKILGISSFYHDSAATITIDGEIIAAVQEERFTRRKHDESFPVNAINFCLEESGLSLDNIDVVVFYDKPILKFERLLETYYAFAPKGVSSFVTAMPVWMREKMFFKKLIKDEFKKIGEVDWKKTKLLFPEHHLSHAASAFYPSPFEESAIMTIDGVGEWATASICYGKDNNIKILRELKFPNSLGLLYSAFTYYLGFKVNSGEYKLMGLAPYGNPNCNQVENFVKSIKNQIIEIKEDGSIRLNQNYFKYATGLRMIQEAKWEKLFGFKTRKPEEELLQVHCNLGLAIQKVTEDVVQLMAKEAKRLTGSSNLCLAGGVALNCVSNGKIQKAGFFDNVYIQPASGDAGGSLGAALAVEYIYNGSSRVLDSSKMDSMKGGYLGPEFSDKDIEKLFYKYGAVATKLSFEELVKSVAKYLDEGAAIGWFQGKMEFGPRALGNRSIIGDPRNPEMQKKLNLKIKYRESFRPFAPSVLAEDVETYFDYKGDSPYMLLVHPVAKGQRKKLPGNYDSLELKEKLYTLRSRIPAITHIDFSARIQTVHKETNPKYWKMIKSFKDLTGCGMVVNTSFNVRGEPIVCNPDDAYRCLMRTEMDFLVVGNYIFKKEKQPDWDNKDNWKKEFKLD